MRSPYIDTELVFVVHGKEFFAKNVDKILFYENDARRLASRREGGRNSGGEAGLATRVRMMLVTALVIVLYPFRFLF